MAQDTEAKMTNFKDKANLIWAVADLLRGDYKQSDYGKIILPMTVLRRLDCVLQPTKQKVCN
jgi:type I restriction enzyme M protein